MPKSHDAKPRNKARRIKAAKTSGTFWCTPSARMEARVRSRRTELEAYDFQNGMRVELAKLGLKWKHYERAYDQASAGRGQVAAILRQMSTRSAVGIAA